VSDVPLNEDEQRALGVAVTRRIRELTEIISTWDRTTTDVLAVEAQAQIDDLISAATKLDLP